jgi:poly(3-hydroxybutyrate) depolymerase
VRFATLELTDLDDPTFEASFHTEYIASVVAFAGVGTYRVSVSGYSAGSAVVSTIVYYPSTTSAARDVFKQTLIFVRATLSSSYGLITATMAAEPPAPVVEVQASPSTPPTDLAAVLLTTAMFAALLLLA